MSRGESIYKLRLDSYLHEHFSSPMLKDVSIAFFYKLSVCLDLG